MLAWLFEAIPVSCRFESACLIVFFLVAGASAEANDRVDTGTLVGKMIMGYQGWFACPDDGGALGWGHWTRGTDPAVDMLPDLSDMPEAAQCLTMMKTADGHSVKLFSNLNLETEEEHFAWMQQYGIDGVALQRFATVLLKPSLLTDLDRVLGNVRRAAEEHTRVFFIMYDLSGVPSVDLPAVAKDWERLEHEGLTRSTAYLHHRGHPLLGVWGLGFAGSSVSPHDAETLLDAFAVASAPYGGVTVLGGVPSYWRSQEHDASSDPHVGTDLASARRYQSMVRRPLRRRCWCGHISSHSVRTGPESHTRTGCRLYAGDISRLFLCQRVASPSRAGQGDPQQDPPPLRPVLLATSLQRFNCRSIDALWCNVRRGQRRHRNV